MTTDALTVNANLVAQYSLGRRAVLLVVLLTSGICTALLFTIPAPILAEVAKHYGGENYGAIVAQLVMTIPAIGMMIGAPIAGLLAQRWGARTLLLRATAAYAIAGSCVFLIDSSVILLSSRLLVGLASAGAAVGTTMLLSSGFHGEVRERMVSYLSAVAAGGGVASLLLAGGVAELGGWRAPFLLYLVGGVICIVGRMVIPDFPKPAPVVRQAGGGSVRLFVPIFATVAIVFAVTFMTGTQTAFLLAANGVSSPSIQAFVISSSSIASMTGAVCYPRFAHHLGRARAFALLLLLLGIGNVVMGISQAPLVTALGCALVGFGGGLTSPHFINLIIDRSNESVRGRALGFLYSSIFLGEFLNPVIVMPFRFGFGIHFAFIAIGTVTTLFGLLALLRARRPAQQG